MKTGRLRECILWVVAALVLYLAFVADRPLNNPDEGRYVEIAREMVVSGDWVTPHLNGVPYFYKPPFVYWLQASSIMLFGLDWVALRFFPALFGALGVGAVFWATSRLFGTVAGRWAACCLATGVLWGALSQVVILDIILSTAIGVALLVFLVAAEGRRVDPKSAPGDGAGPAKRGPHPIALSLVFYAALAVAVMTKGLVGLLIPAAVIGLWFILSGRWAEILRMRLVLGAAIFLTLVVPWHVAVSLANPPLESGLGLFSQETEGRGFFWFYFVHEHFLRYFEDVSSRPAPFWFFAVILPVGFFPWVAFLPFAVWDAVRGGWQQLRRADAAKLYLLVWVVFVVVFFSISKSKLVPYILPAVPPLAVLTGEWLSRALRGSAALSRGRSLRLSLRLFQVSALILAIGFAVAAMVVPDKFTIGAIQMLGVIMAAGVLAAIAVQCALRKGWEDVRCVAVAVVLGVILVIGFNPLATAMQRPSTLASARFIQTNLPTDMDVFVFYDYYQDFPVYLERAVGVIAHVPTEQRPGLAYGDFSQRYLDGDGLSRLFSPEGEAAVCLLRREHIPILNFLLEDRIRAELFGDEHFVVVGNQAALAKVGERSENQLSSSLP